MSDHVFTNKQLAFQWLCKELITHYLETGDFVLIHEFLSSLPNQDRTELLRFFFWYGVESFDFHLAEHCLKEGDPFVLPDREFSDWEPLHEALECLGDRPDVIEWLLQHGADIERRDLTGCTALLVAAACGHEQSASTLLKHGADVNASTGPHDGFTPLMAAAAAGNKEIVRMLLVSGADPRRRDCCARTAEEIAKSAGHHEITELFQ